MQPQNFPNHKTTTMNVILVSLAVLGLMEIPVMGRILERCEMAKELLSHGFQREQLADWVCLIQQASNFNTAAVYNYNIDGSKDYGLFKINSHYWCVEGRQGNGCNVNCYDLISDDITASCECAKIIYGRQGFGEWAGWYTYCSRGRSPSVDHCFY